MDTSIVTCQDERASSYINSFWQIKGAPAYQSEIILPKGAVELIFSFNDPVPFSRKDGNEQMSTPRCFLNGMNNEPVHLEAPAQQAFFGIVLNPAAVKKLLFVPCGSFLNTIIDLEILNKEFGTLWHQLAEIHTFHARVRISEQWIIQRMGSIHPQDKAIASYLTNNIEPGSVAGLAAELCYSPRQLHRKAQEFFGMSTERLIGYKRYLTSLHYMHQGMESLTKVAYHCNYYDQAHFIREFREFTGLTPGEYRLQKTHLPGHLFQ
jgi:AraC-like DNA-binding protein